MSDSAAGKTWHKVAEAAAAADGIHVALE